MMTPKTFLENLNRKAFLKVRLEIYVLVATVLSVRWWLRDGLAANFLIPAFLCLVDI